VIAEGLDVTVKINCWGSDSVLNNGTREIEDDGVGDDEVRGVYLGML